MCNGETEMYTTALLDMLDSLAHERKNDRTIADNPSKHESTGVLPFELLYGRYP